MLKGWFTMDFIQNLDVQILLYIQEHFRTQFLDTFFVGFTHLGDGGILWICISLILMIFRKTRRIGFVCAVSLMIGALVTNVTLKNIVARPRPFDTIQDLTVLIKYPTDYSFPSGHTTSWLASGTSMFLMLNKKYSYVFLILASIMGFSRLYVGVHYPTDVLCGLIIGVFSAIISYNIIRVIYKNRELELTNHMD